MSHENAVSSRFCETAWTGQRVSPVATGVSLVRSVRTRVRVNPGTTGAGRKLQAGG
jgi:hypothetical protein